MIQNYMRTLLQRVSTPDFEAKDNAPETWQDVRALGKANVIWTGNSEQTIWGAPCDNWQFRHWHDTLHLRYELDFSNESDVALATLHAAALESYSTYAARMVYADTAGQVAHYNAFDCFPSDQLAFALHYVKTGHVAKF